MSNELVSGLNQAQREAVVHSGGPLLVLAGPGSGKTRVVTTRIAHLLNKGAASQSMLALTFTNKAAAEMAARVARMVSGQSVWVSTFHRFCSRVLRNYAALVGLDENFTIYDTDDSLALLKAVIESQQVNMGRYTPRQIAQTISRAKNDLICPEDLANSYRPIDVVAAEIYPQYQKRMVAANAVDFDDLLLHVVRLLHDNEELRRELDERYQYILVDEYQDTNLAQYGIIRGLSIDHPNLTVTGDPDQSIYAWRGANIENILRFEQDYPGAAVVRLEQNYRSTPNILRVADDLIAANVRRKAKNLWTENDAGRAVQVTEYHTGHSEAEGIVDAIAADIDAGKRRPRDFAILYRTNALSRGLEHAFRARGIPYQIVRGIEFYKRREIKDMLSYMQLVSNPQDEIAFLRVINAPPRGIGKVTLRKLKDYAGSHGLSLYEAARHEVFLSSLSKRFRVTLSKFSAELDNIAAAASGSVEMLVNQVLDTSGYRDHLESSENEEDRQRLANVEELCTAAKEFDERHDESSGLEGFLEQVALVNETDDWADESDKVTLLTMHAAKGLEFPVVFIIAVEAGILPHERSKEDFDQLEEERRLLFVAITRAESELCLSCATYRDYRGTSKRRVPSSFLMELRNPEIDFVREDAATWPTRNEVAEFAREKIQRPDSPAFRSRRLREDGLSLEPTEYLPDDAAEFTQAPAEPVYDEAAQVPPLLTAADLVAGDELATEASPGAIRVGGLVMHPVHGPGKVLDMSGSGTKQTVAVQFIQPPTQRTFRVAFSPLKPITATGSS